MTVEMNTKLNDDDAVHTLPALNKLDADAARAQPTLDDKLDQELDVEKRSASDESFVDDDGLEELTPAQVKTERRFLWKLDLLLLSWSWFAYCLKQIDSSNYKTAYVSGMKEDLNLTGNELNYFDTCFRVGYALFLIPSQLVLADGRIPTRIWLPALECAWGVCVGLMACMKSATGIYVLRFFIGVFEASSYPGIISVLCSWYTPAELATRIAIFGTSYPGAQIFVSSMQSALAARELGMLKPWQWLFVFNALMTIFVAAFGFILIPDDPAKSTVRWLNAAERDIARIRVYRVQKLPARKVSRSLLKKVFTSWTIYVFTAAYAFWGWSQNSSTWMSLFLKAVKNADGTKRFTIPQLNAIPIGGYVLQILAMLAFGWLSDRKGWRASLVIVQQATVVIGCIILAAWPTSFGLKMFGYHVLFLSNSAGPILVAWMADMTPCPSQRAIIIGVTCTIVYAVDSFANILIYPAKKAPNYPIGYKAAAAFAVASIAATGLFYHLDRKTRAAREARDKIEFDCTCPPESRR